MKALRYHARRPTGKTQITATKPCDTATDLALAYTPGVATPCRAIQRHPDSVYRYTNKGNLVAIVSNGTAVLGLGNLGPLAAKPVMEGKSLLFKRLADIDAFDLELDVSPVHDGATIVEGDRITRVGALLPLSQNEKLPRTWGTRHRAGMGLAERSDAIVVEYRN